jgi:long-subunit acyl-CoA synthetase (AMP-forming)
MERQEASLYGILGHFLKYEATTPEAVFLRQPLGNAWQEYTWQEAGTKARQLVARWQEMNLAPGSRIAILSQNCAEWVICDLATMMGGYVSVPLYANVDVHTLQDILNHSEAEILIIGKLNSMDWQQIKPAIPTSIKTFSMTGFEKEDIPTWKEYLAGETKEASIVYPALDDMLTIIYTSGTTGMPKGVVHTFGSMIKAVEAAQDLVFLNNPGNRFFSYLPLSHAAERGLVEFGAIFSGGSISFVESLETFLSNLQAVQPTHFLGVPRIWEKFQMNIWQKLPQKRLDLLLKIPFVSCLLGRKLKKAMGLNKAVILLCGAAPISPDLLRWFARLGFHIQEAYGMSENFNVCAINPKTQIRIGTVGKLVDQQEVKIIPETHEVIQRADWVMQGYFKEPELSVKTIRQGYLHTGDMGQISEDGYLTLLGRVKDIFKTTKGEYIVPLKTENLFLGLKEVDQVCLLGVQYPQPFLIVVLSEYGKKLHKNKMAEKLQAVLEEGNKSLMGYQKVKKVVVVQEEWTHANNLLTPTLKMKRNAIGEKYEVKLHHLYYSDELVTWEQEPKIKSR